MSASIRSAHLIKAGQNSVCRNPSPRLAASRPFHSHHLSSLAIARPIPRYLHQQRPWQSTTFIRRNTNLTASPSSHISPTPKAPTSSSPTATHPAYEIYFTCKPCSHRSGPHRVTKQGFHTGTTLITCPSCKNRHVVSDHLRIFTDQGGDLVDIMRRHGEKLKKGRLGIRDGQLIGNEGEEEIEFWEDGTETSRSSQESKTKQ